MFWKTHSIIYFEKQRGNSCISACMCRSADTSWPLTSAWMFQAEDSGRNPVWTSRLRPHTSSHTFWKQNFTENCGQANIQTHSEFKFCWSISCYTAQVHLQRPWCLCPIWEFPYGGRLSWQSRWGRWYWGATVYELESLLYILNLLIHKHI